VGREEEGMSSNRPELVVLREFLESHPDDENLLYLTDSETTLQDINKWMEGGAKLSLAKTADADILRVIIVGRMKQEQEKTWSTSTNCKNQLVLGSSLAINTSSIRGYGPLYCQYIHS
jgi:hypothetical protein